MGELGEYGRGSIAAEVASPAEKHLDEQKGVTALADAMYLLVNTDIDASNEHFFLMLTHEFLRTLRQLHDYGLKNPCQQNDDNWYALATIIMADAFYLDTERKHDCTMVGKMLGRIFKVPAVSLVQDATPHFCGQIGEMFFGEIWRSLYAHDIHSPAAIVRDVWRARPPIKPSSGYRPGPVIEETVIDLPLISDYGPGAC